MGELVYELTNDDYVAFNHYAYDNAEAFVKYGLRQRILFTACFAVITLTGGWVVELWLALIAALGVAAVVWFSWPWLMHRSIESQLKRVSSSGNVGRTGPVWLRWDAERLTEDFHGYGTYVQWWRIERVGETADHLFLFLGQLDAVLIPKRAGAGVADLAGYARSRVAMRPSR